MKKSQKLRIAIIGCGDFAKDFVPLFKAHPLVEYVCVCDKIKKKALDYQKKFNVDIMPDFETVLADKSINSVAIFTQRHTHGPLVEKALLAEKNVYCAVPMASKIEECQRIVELVKKSRLIYMMGETCVYYPCSMYCRQEFEKGTFGKFVYGESQYFHDISHFPKTFIEDKPNSAVPPFLYPTHSTAMILNATGGAYVKSVSAMGYKDDEPDTPFAEGENPWNNIYSNEFSLMQLSNGGIARVSECRRIGYRAPSSYISGFYGTKGSYQFSNAQHIVTTLTPEGVDLEDVSDKINPIAMTEHKDDSDFKKKVANHCWQANDPSPIQEERISTLPKEYDDLYSCHMFSHKMLIDDFCTSVYYNRLPKVNAWLAARYTIPGLIAHESCMQGGKILEVPDCGDAPEWDE